LFVPARGTEVRCVKSLHLVVCKHVAGAKVYDTKVTVRSVRAVIENSVVVVSTCICRDDKNSDIRIATNLVQTTSTLSAKKISMAEAAKLLAPNHWFPSTTFILTEPSGTKAELNSVCCQIRPSCTRTDPIVVNRNVFSPIENRS